MIKPSLCFLSCALAVCWLPSSAKAQLSLYSVQSGVATQVSQVFDFGTVTAGTGESVTFQIQYAGTANPYYLTYFSMNGVGFAVTQTDWTSLPAAIPATGLNFTVQFLPTQAGAFSAPLQINQADALSVFLLGQGSAGTVTQSLTYFVSGAPITAGQTISFPGSIQTNSTESLPMTLSNLSSVALVVPSVSIQGSDFSLPDAPLSGVTVPPGTSVQQGIVFAPSGAGTRTGTLTIGNISFPLQGIGVAAPPPQLPQPSVVVTLPSPASAEQGAIAISLASGAATAATGTVTMTFAPSVNGVSDDPAICFPDGTRSASFAVAAGASSGQFSAGPSLAFATGTTAGTITFDVSLGGNSAQTNVTIAASEIGIDAAVASRDIACIPIYVYCTASNVELEINGWDNTRSASQVVFRFYGPAGEVSPGDIPWTTAASAFSSYFAGSEGGTFSLNAVFPITGDSTQVTYALVLITNSVGTTETMQIDF